MLLIRIILCLLGFCICTIGIGRGLYIIKEGILSKYTYSKIMYYGVAAMIFILSGGIAIFGIIVLIGG